MLHVPLSRSASAPEFHEPAAIEATSPASDYEVVRRTIEFISNEYRSQPQLAAVAAALGVEESVLESVFRRWSGLTPKAFLQAVTIDHARRLLADGASLLDASLEVGLSGPSRLHDLFVKHEAMSPGLYKAKGEGIELRYGFHDTPFGRALLIARDGGLAGLAFAEAGEAGEAHALEDMRRRWPSAILVQDAAGTAPLAARVFRRDEWQEERPLRIVMIGTDFEIRVWEALLAIPIGQATTYGAIAERIGLPKASRAVGAAVGRNPISFVVPCHRVVGKTGALTGYHWGITRKRAMLGWEAGVLARE